MLNYAFWGQSDTLSNLLYKEARGERKDAEGEKRDTLALFFSFYQPLKNVSGYYTKYFTLPMDQ